jgi:hypothetical protein
MVQLLEEIEKVNEKIRKRDEKRNENRRRKYHQEAA